MIWSRMPCTMDAIAITVATPITTPSIVSAERSLLARSWSRAMSHPSDTEWSFTLPFGMRIAECGLRNGPRDRRSRRPTTGIEPSPSTPHFAFHIPHLDSFVPQGDHGVELRGAHRRVHAEHDAHAGAEPEGDRDRPQRHPGGERRERVDDGGEARPGEQAEQATQQRERHRLREELVADVL